MVPDLFQALVAAGGHTGAMIALIPSEADAQRLAVDDGEPAEELHVTLAYLGDAVMIPAEVRHELIDSISRFTTDHPTIVGNAFSVNLFNPENKTITAGAREPCVVLGIGGSQLQKIHGDIVFDAQRIFAVNGVEFPQQHLPWIPHMTLVYTSEADLTYFTDRMGPVTFDAVRLAFGDDIYDIPLGDNTEESDDVISAGFNPDQPRDSDGQWTDGPGGSGKPDISALWNDRANYTDKIVWTKRSGQKGLPSRVIGTGDGFKEQYQPKGETEWSDVRSLTQNDLEKILASDKGDFSTSTPRETISDDGVDIGPSVDVIDPPSSEPSSTVSMADIADVTNWQAAASALTDKEAHSSPHITNRENLRSLAGANAVNGVRRYVGTEYNSVNYALRMTNGDVTKIPQRIDGIYDDKSEVTSMIDGLDDAMKASKLPSVVLTYRGILSPEDTFGESWDDDGDMSGLTWMDGSYASTSTDPKIARRFADEGAGVLMRVLVPANTPAIGIEGVEIDGKIVKPESELLLNRGLTYRVVRDHMINGTRTLDVEVV